MGRIHIGTAGRERRQKNRRLHKDCSPPVKENLRRHKIDKAKLLDTMTDLSYRMNQLVQTMYQAGFTDDDIQWAVEEGAKEYRVMMGEDIIEDGYLI